MRTRWSRWWGNTVTGAVLACAWVAAAHALEVHGEVVDEAGRALPYVRLRMGGEGSVPFTTTVFSDADGRFSAVPGGVAADRVEVDAFRVGWKESSRKRAVGEGAVNLRITMRRVDNVADQVPASAWLKGDPDSRAFQMTVTQCSNCHQLGAARVRAFSEKLAGLAAGSKSDAWLRRAAEDLGPKLKGDHWKSGDGQQAPAQGRSAAWEAMVQYMRFKTLRLGEHDELRWGLKEGSPTYQALLQPEYSLFSPEDMAIVVPNLAHNFPVRFDVMRGYDDLQRLGRYGVTQKTVITEYLLPTFGWTRELAIAPGSNKVWFLETDKDRLGALDPADGSVTWHPIPGKGRQGPHTMNADAQGNLWMGLEESFSIGRFNTHTGEWRMYPPPPGTDFGVTHDFAINSDRHVEADAQGRIWITDMGKNELWGVNVETGEIQKHRQPRTQGESHFHSLLYGAAIDTKRHRVWWAQLFANAGSFDTESNVADLILPFKKGEGPRRLALEDDGTLWIPLYGAAQVVRINPDTAREMARYTIPDRGAGPYGVTFDKKRQAVWAATSNSDRIYRLDVATGQWRHYPMPRRETYIRMIEVDPVNGDVWTTYSSLPVGKRDPKVYGIESANNIIVRLQPGD